MKTIIGSCLCIVAIFVASPLETLAGSEPATINFTGGSQSEFQALLDNAPAGAVVVCKQSKPLEVSTTLSVRKPVTLRGFKACLPPKLGDTPILIVDAEQVTLTDIEMRGNYDSVDQKVRAPLIHVKRGGITIERCKFFDGSKDGIMLTPDDGTCDIVGGTIRDIEGSRMGRDLVLLSGGNTGLRIRDVTVENIRLKTGFFRGAVEVSDGTDNITVRHVYVEDALYGIDVQDHGAIDKKTGKKCAPNTKVVLEDVTAVRCKFIIRTANHDLGHADLTLRGFTGRECQEPVQISNTKRVLIENLTITNEKPLDGSPVVLSNDNQVIIRNATIKGTAEGVASLMVKADCTDVRLERVTCNGAAVEQPAIGDPRKAKKKNRSAKPN